MPLRPIDKSADEHGDRNEVDKDPQQLDQVALGRLARVPPATHRLLVRLPSCPPGCSRPPRLSQPPETTAADDNAFAPALLGTRDDDDLTRLRAGEATSLGAADGHGSRIGEPSNNRADWKYRKRVKRCAQRS